MTNAEAIEIIKTEEACVRRRVAGGCDGGVMCRECDLARDDEDVLMAYRLARAALMVEDDGT